MGADAVVTNGTDSDGSCTEDTRKIGEVQLQALTCGRGESVLVLHDYEYLNEPQPFIDRIAAQGYRLVVPSHPGFGASNRPEQVETIGDLAYFYDDVVHALFGDDARVHLVGLGLGGWIAAEMAVRCSHQLASLSLVDSVGIKISDRETRDIADSFVLGNDEILKLMWHDPTKGEQIMKLPGLKPLSESVLLTVLRNRETAARFAWKPFMYNPKLLVRLGRIRLPTLVLWGNTDHMVTPAYGKAFADAIPGARFEAINEAGHYPYLEQPGAFADTLTGFLKAHAANTRPTQSTRASDVAPSR